MTLLFGFIIGLILIIFSKKIKYFLRYTLILSKSFFSSQKHELISDKLCLIDSSRTWMYELRDENYDPHTFSFSMTNICLIEIHKSILLVFQPLNEPNHKLNDSELDSKVIFNQVEIYNLNKAIISLLPANMIRSKYWSKKSPIVLRNILYLGQEKIRTLSTDISVPSNQMNERNVRKTLLFFTRTRRSKEDWFYRFVHASQLDSWRKEIHYQLEQGDMMRDEKQICMTETLSRKQDVPMENNDEEHKTQMIEFLKRADRFAALDQLHYLKPVDVIQKILPNLKKTSTKQGKQNDNEKIKNLKTHSLSSSKRHYCERWLMEQNLINDNEEKRIKQKVKIKHQKIHFHRDKNTNGADISDASRTSLQTDPNQFQHKSHPLLFCVLKYLQKIPYDTKENKIQNPIELMNIFAARCFVDFFENEQYLERIQTFIQKQLRKINIPFIEHITITNLNLGDRLPEIKDIFKPWIDEHGLWSHIKISFDGQLQLTLSAKLKLIRKNRTIGQISRKNTSVSHSNDFEDEETIFPNPGLVKKPWYKRLRPLSHWFRHRQSNFRTPLPNKNRNNHQQKSYLKTILPKISKTTIVIKLEVNNVNGILVFNIPPIPSDRIWISFLDMPQMEFSATPHLGEFRVSFYKIKDKLEKKLRQIFRRYLVMPNMKDWIIPTVDDYLSEIGIVKAIPSVMKANNQQSSKISEKVSIRINLQKTENEHEC